MRVQTVLLGIVVEIDNKCVMSINHFIVNLDSQYNYL